MTGMSWCVEALRGYSGGGAGARLELGGALAALRAHAGRASRAAPAGLKALQRLKAVARAHPNDRVLRAEANADAAFVAYALGNLSEAKSLSESAAREDPYSCAARLCSALATAALGSGADGDNAWRDAAEQIAAASHLDPADLIAMHDHALSLEKSGSESAVAGATARWARVRGAGGAGGTLRAMAAAGLARLATRNDPAAADHWYSTIGSWDAGVSCALAELHSELGDSQTAKHHYQDVEAAWPCSLSALGWLASEARGSRPERALQYYRRAARAQPNNPRWGLLMGECLRSAGRYQEALALYKKMNTRFPDNVQCLKLIVKLCGDQGLGETSAWSRELQRAQARAAQQHTVSIPSASSGSSGHSQSPIDQIRGDSASVQRTARAPPSRHSSDGRGAGDSLTHSYTFSGDSTTHEVQPMSRNIRTEARRKKIEEDEDELPLPPE